MMEHQALEHIEINHRNARFDGIARRSLLCGERCQRSGSRIALPFYIFSSDFGLSLDGFKTTTRCHVVWRRGELHCSRRISP